MENSDPINPEYYAQGKVQCIEFIENWPFNIATAVKYMWRYKDKGNPGQDLEKAIWYLERQISNMELNEQGKLFYSSHKIKSGVYGPVELDHIKSKYIKAAIYNVWGEDFDGVFTEDIQKSIYNIKNEIEELENETRT